MHVTACVKEGKSGAPLFNQCQRSTFNCDHQYPGKLPLALILYNVLVTPPLRKQSRAYGISPPLDRT